MEKENNSTDTASLPEQDALVDTQVKDNSVLKGESLDKNIKKHHSFVPIIIIILALGSAIGVFFLVKSLQTPETVVVVDGLPEEEEKFLETSSEILFTEGTLPRIDASLATQPLTDAFVKNFTGKTTE